MGDSRGMPAAVIRPNRSTNFGCQPRFPRGSAPTRLIPILRASDSHATKGHNRLAPRVLHLDARPFTARFDWHRRFGERRICTTFRQLRLKPRSGEERCDVSFQKQPRRSWAVQQGNGVTEIMGLFSKQKRDLFQLRARQQEVWRSVRRIIDSTAPNVVSADHESRKYDRCQRCLPAIVIPCDAEGEPSGQASLAITRDFADHGVGVILNQTPNSELVICGFWTDEPHFFLGAVRQNQQFGACFCALGIELIEVISPEHIESLVPLLDDLATTTGALAAC